jgi:PAS domain S-box-containing protein
MSERYRELTDSIPQLMWTATPDGRLDYANERCLHYTGYKTAEEYAANWVASLHPDDLARVNDAWKTSSMAGIMFKEEYRIRRSDGVYHWFLGRVLPIRGDDQKIKYWIGTATDIEELKVAKEAAEKANVMKSAFLANMSHEIRTPLGAILGFSGLLKDSELSTKDREQFIEIIERNGRNLTRIIDDILDLAKVEAGLLEVEKLPFSFVELIKDVSDLFQEKVREKKINLLYNVESSFPKMIVSDPTRLKQILMNVIGNAIKFTDSGGVYIRAYAVKKESGYFFNVEVKDTGCGISEEESRRLFKPFTQADNTTTRKFGGTGLGLSLSKRLAQALGGDITITQLEKGKGATFLVKFAGFAQAEKSEKEFTPTSFKNSEAVLSGLHILVVDDSVENQMLVSNLLRKFGAQVDVASNGQEAVYKAKSSVHNCVLMDIQMPKMDGYEAAGQLLASGYKTPIIALTAHAMVEDRAKTMRAGFADHLTKPVQPNDLVNAILENSFVKA